MKSREGLVMRFRAGKVDAEGLVAELKGLILEARQQGEVERAEELGELAERVEMIVWSVCEVERRGAILELLDGW